MRLRRYGSKEEPLYSIITKYERATIIGVRSHQIANDPTKPCIVPIGDLTDTQKMAELEYAAGVIPMIIKRKKGLVDDDDAGYWVIDSDQHVFKGTWTIVTPEVGANYRSEDDCHRRYPLDDDGEEDWSKCPADPTIPIFAAEIASATTTIMAG